MPFKSLVYHYGSIEDGLRTSYASQPTGPNKPCPSWNEMELHWTTVKKSTANYRNEVGTERNELSAIWTFWLKVVTEQFDNVVKM